MPIRIEEKMPAAQILCNENLDLLPKSLSKLPELKILIINIMPTKIETETQLLRLLSNSVFDIDIDFIHMESHVSKNTSKEHLLAFYKTFTQIKNNKYDGMILTGAPIEKLEFEEVGYWSELCQIMDWSENNVCTSLYICWGAQAALYHHYGIGKYQLSEKLSGVFPHEIVCPNHPLVRGFENGFLVPHSRYTAIDVELVKSCGDISPLCVSKQTGLHLIAAKNGKRFFVTGHSEYDVDTLAKEYARDVSKGVNTKIPFNYFPQDDPDKQPVYTWKAHANLFITNWINYYVYNKRGYNERDFETL